MRAHVSLATLALLGATGCAQSSGPGDASSTDADSAVGLDAQDAASVETTSTSDVGADGGALDVGTDALDEALGDVGCDATLASDPANCGACGTSCCAGTVCVGGICTGDCTSGQTACPVAMVGCAGGYHCVNTTSDTMNCGACGHACGPALACRNGCCVPYDCPAPLEQCGCNETATCADLQNDSQHCGSCTNRCAAGQACVNGVCT
jgi:hypothetical protein